MDDFNAAKAMRCYDDLSKEFDAVMAEHKELMKSLTKKHGAKWAPAVNAQAGS